MPRAAKLDLHAAEAFLASVPAGRWTSYAEVAVAGGRTPMAAQPIASWIGSKGHLLPRVYRVLNKHGEISPGWTPAGPGLPANAAAVADLLQREGVRFRSGKAAQSQFWSVADWRRAR